MSGGFKRLVCGLAWTTRMGTGSLQRTECGRGEKLIGKAAGDLVALGGDPGVLQSRVVLGMHREEAEFPGNLAASTTDF